MKNKVLLTVLLLSFACTAFSQNRYVIHLTDKNNSPFSVSNPLAYLSQRSIDRRNHQGISVDITDLPVNPSYVQGISGTGATVLNKSKWLNTVTVEISNPNQLTAINALPYVSNVSNIGRHANGNTNPLHEKFADEKKFTPAQTSASYLRTSSFNYGQAVGQTQMIGINNLHDQGYSGQGMLIALLDGGFQDANIMPCFDSIFANNQVIATWDFVDNETNVYDNNWHGASVLSTIAANDPGNMVGTAPHANFILLRSEDVNSEYIIEEYNYASAAEYADSAGADVMHSSLGYTQFDDSAQDHYYEDMNGNTAPCTIAADLAAKKGILVTSSAGNEGNSAWNYISAPADGDSVLAVGAVDQSAQYVSFSSNGPSYDGRVKPDVAAVGGGTFLYMPFQPGVTQGNGTSFSGPIMAGAAACLWQSWPSRSNMEIIQAIKRSANQYSNPDTLLGYGIPNFATAYSLLSLGEINVPSSEILHIYPNPALEQSSINAIYKSSDTGSAIIQLLDMAGRLISSTTQYMLVGYNKISIQTPTAKGIYILQISSDNGEVSKKFVKE
jgi:hypothetical protein